MKIWVIIGGAVSVLAILAAGWAIDDRYAPLDDFEIAQLQIQDVYDERIKQVLRTIVKLEETQRARPLTAQEQQHLADQRREYERLRGLRYGK